MPDDESPSRGRGILTEADRAYVRDPDRYAENHSRQSVNERQKKIPERIRNGLVDLSIIADPEFPPDLLRAAFQDPDKDPEPVGEAVGEWEDREPEVKELQPSDGDVEQGLVDAIALTHYMFHRNVATEMIEDGTKAAIRRYYPDYEVIDASYEPDIERRGAAHGMAKHALEEGRELTDEQIRLLIQKGEVDPQRVIDHVREPVGYVSEDTDLTQFFNHDEE